LPATAAAERIFSKDVLDLGRQLFGGSPRQVASAFRRFSGELARSGDNLDEPTLARFLQYQYRHRDLHGARVPIEVVCNGEDLDAWRRDHSVPKNAKVVEVDSPAPMPTEADRARSAEAATKARLAFEANLKTYRGLA
jgi:hypothetical protein